MTTPREGPEVPFDRSMIQAMRERADAHAENIYDKVPSEINWLWYSRMVTTLELSLTNQSEGNQND